MKRNWLWAAAVVSMAVGAVRGEEKGAPVDLSQGKTLYVVGYAHLDTQWRWSYPQVIREFVANTLRNNFPLIEKYPHYVFNFSGSRRYEFMKEYYPAEYAKLKEYVKAGRWFPCGSSVDENDANVPSAESLVRQVLYGNHFFRREFGVASDEYMLPDCFGFPYALPTVLAHCGIKGFSTQKLTWGSSVGIPFKVGVWKGPDGKSVIAALDPGSYTGVVGEDLSHSDSWIRRVEADGEGSGVFADFHYYGTGDRGGAPAEDSVAMVEKAATAEGAPLRVISTRADALFNAITPEQRNKLPVYDGELLLTQHSAGSPSSEAHMKRWNRKNELLADAAEKASVAAMWLGAQAYPSRELYTGWDLVLGSQMHDMLPGTSLPKAYEYCWNDELLAANFFGQVATNGVEAVGASMDTRGEGTSVIVYNPLSVEREDVAEAYVNLGGKTGVKVVGPDGKEVAAQIAGDKVIFLAKCPSVGFAAYDIQATDGVKDSTAIDTTMKVSEKGLENERYRVTIDGNGDVGSVFDKKNNREVLGGPARLAMMYENPEQYPAWNMDWEDQRKAPQYYVEGPAKVRVVEDGPVRVAVEIERESQGSKFVQRVRLAKGSDRVEFANVIDWRTKEHALKAVFPMAVSNPSATYDIQVGTVKRENDNPKKYEFPQHQWIDLSKPDDSYGASVLSECKYGSDKPSDNTVRLTLIYTPGTRAGFGDQGTQDIGRHEFLYGLSAHAGAWSKDAQTPLEAARLNQPLLVFGCQKHEGAMGKELSLVSTSSKNVLVTAVKKAEDSDEVVVRVRNLSPEKQEGVVIKMAGQMVSAREVDGQEREMSAAEVKDGVLRATVGGYSLKAFAIKLGTPAKKGVMLAGKTVALPLDTDVVSTREKLADGEMDGEGRTLAAETWPGEVVSGGVQFKLGSGADGEKNAVSCNGQKVEIGEGGKRVVYLLAAASGGKPTDRSPWAFVEGTVGFDKGDGVKLSVSDFDGYVGQWDNRSWKGEVPELTYEWHNEMSGLAPGWVNQTPVAYYSSHTHLPKVGDEYYRYAYLFKYGVEVPAGATAVVLPKEGRIKVFAMTVVEGARGDGGIARGLYDELKGREAGVPTIMPAGGKFTDATKVKLGEPLYYQEGGLRYTTDGSEPTEGSAVYDGKGIAIGKTTTVKVREIGGPVATETIEVEDVTAPKVLSATAVGPAGNVRLVFSEPVDGETARKVGTYQLDPGAEISSVKVGEDGRSAVLTLGKGLTEGGKYVLLVKGLKDASPKGNVEEVQQVELPVYEPVYQKKGTVKGKPMEELEVAKLPVKGSEAWTLNMVVRAAKQPGNRTMLAGFGSMKDEDGKGRYFAKFGNGIHFWVCHRDVDTNEPLDLGKWQMLTATYDGGALRLYKNGKLIGEKAMKLEDDEAAVRVLPLDPWDHKRKFGGEVRDLSVWSGALPGAALEQLWGSLGK